MASSSNTFFFGWSSSDHRPALLSSAHICCSNIHPSIHPPLDSQYGPTTAACPRCCCSLPRAACLSVEAARLDTSPPVTLSRCQRHQSERDLSSLAARFRHPRSSCRGRRPQPVTRAGCCGPPSSRPNTSPWAALYNNPRLRLNTCPLPSYTYRHLARTSTPSAPSRGARSSKPPVASQHKPLRRANPTPRPPWI